jgi:hypothetical protein
MGAGNEHDTSPEAVVDRFRQFVEAHCRRYASPEERPTPESLGSGLYVLDRYPGTTHRNVRVEMSVTDFDSGDGVVGVHYGLSYLTEDEDEIWSILHASEDDRSFWVSNGGEIDEDKIDPNAVLEVMGDINGWENSGRMLPAASEY